MYRGISAGVGRVFVAWGNGAALRRAWEHWVMNDTFERRRGVAWRNNRMVGAVALSHGAPARGQRRVREPRCGMGVCGWWGLLRKGVCMCCTVGRVQRRILTWCPRLAATVAQARGHKKMDACCDKRGRGGAWGTTSGHCARGALGSRPRSRTPARPVPPRPPRRSWAGRWWCRSAQTRSRREG